MARVYVPPQWRDLTGGVAAVTAEGRTLRQVVASLEAQHPGIAGRLCQGDKLAGGLAVAIDGALAHRGLLTPVTPDSEIHILPAVAGG